MNPEARHGMNIIFLGTPEFAVPSLTAVLSSRHRVLAVITQPDRAADKGRVKPSPVKELAISQGIPVLQYDKVSTEGLESVQAYRPDIMVTAAFGQILAEEFLKIAPVYNVHASLLPLYRGSSPIQAAILSGDKETGVTIMETVKALDAGDILLQEKLAIADDEPFYSLQNRLAELGGGLIVEALDKTENGTLRAAPQRHEKATYTRKVAKEHGRINWSEDAGTIARKIRAYNPWPTGYAAYGAGYIKIYAAKPVNSGSMPGIEPGIVLSADEKAGLQVQCGSGVLSILCLQAPGKRALPTAEFLRGYKIAQGSRFS